MHANLTILIGLLFTPGIALAQFPPIIDLADTTANITVIGASAGNHSGYSIAAGDIDGDSLQDLIISSFGESPLGGQREGEFEIIWGNALRNNGFIDFAFPSDSVSRIFGKSNDRPIWCELATGDINNDGCDDIIIGEPFSRPLLLGGGKAYIIFGSPDFPDTLDLGSNPPNVTTVNGGIRGGYLGQAICACDVNGDNYDDVIISAHNLMYGEIYIIYGADTLPQTFDTGPSLSGSTRIIDYKEYSGTGWDIACSDIDKDGYDDLLFGSPGILLEEPAQGEATLLYGQAIFPDTLLLSDESFRIKRIFGKYEYRFFGNSVAIGDINKDTNSDLIISASSANPLGCECCGEVYVLYNAAQIPDSISVATSEYPMTRILGEDTSELYGHRLYCTDLNSDDAQDIIITALGLDNDPSSFDKVVIVYGGWTMPDSIFLATDTSVTRIYAEKKDDGLGCGITSGDFNQDNIIDLVLGADWNDPLGRQNAGATYLFYGIYDPTGINKYKSPQFILRQNYPNPFSRTTTIEYFLSEPSPVNITIYNVLGQRITQIFKSMESTGPHSIAWNGLNDQGESVSSGIYLYRLKAGGL